ncbi:MAG: hypothetical protein M1825_000043 [Sarcosagium campestre]|nr:MAG: hypothetical protein M1825_000043 [Sarcosagium campestre]
MSADFLAGYLSGAVGIIVGNPLDLIKVRLQAGPLSLTPGTSSPLKYFDSAGSLVRGATAPILGYGALNALLFVSYNRTLLLLGDEPSSPFSAWKTFFAGATGGLAQWVVSAPTELIKCRTQLSPLRHTSWEIARETIRTSGLRGLYFGGSITSLRDSVGYGF